jgi:hypothetical protein
MRAAFAYALLATAATMGLTHCESDDTPRTAPPAPDAAEAGKSVDGSSDATAEATSGSDSASDSGRDTGTLDSGTTAETGTREAGTEAGKGDSGIADAQEGG